MTIRASTVSVATSDALPSFAVGVELTAARTAQDGLSAQCPPSVQGYWAGPDLPPALRLRAMTVTARTLARASYAGLAGLAVYCELTPVMADTTNVKVPGPEEVTVWLKIN